MTFRWNIISLDEIESVAGFLGLASQAVEERHVGEQTVLILRVADLSEHLRHILLGDLVSEVAQDVVELSEHHGAVLVFVVRLQELEVVGVCSLAVGGLQGRLNHADDVVELGELLALLVGLAEANAHLLGGVVAHGVHDVAEVEQVELTLAIPVVDVTDLLNSISVNHLDCCGGASSPRCWLLHDRPPRWPYPDHHLHG